MVYTAEGRADAGLDESAVLSKRAGRQIVACEVEPALEQLVHRCRRSAGGDPPVVDVTDQLGQGALGVAPSASDCWLRAGPSQSPERESNSRPTHYEGD